MVNETDVDFEIEEICTTLTGVLNDEKVDTRLASMQWFNMLLEKMPDKLFGHLQIIFPALLHALSDKEDKVVHECSGCGLAMAGSPDHAAAHAGYTLHFCAAACKEGFEADPAGGLAHLSQILAP